MNCLVLHVDVIDSREYTAELTPDDCRLFSICCQSVLSLLARPLGNASVWWAGDGGFCIIQTDGRGSKVAELLRIAQAYPAYVTQFARPPLLQVASSRPLQFRRGVSWIDDVPSVTKLDGSSIGSHKLADALKSERAWISDKPSRITVWREVHKRIKATTPWMAIEQRRVVAGPTGPIDVVDLQPQPLEHATDAGLIQHLMALQWASLQSLRSAKRRHPSNAAEALTEAFEPERYMRETLTAIKNYMESVVAPQAVVRTAVFVPDAARSRLELLAAAARSAHTAREIPLSDGAKPPAAAAQAYLSKEPRIVADTTRPTPAFLFLHDRQKEVIRSHMSIPILETQFLQIRDNPLPAPSSSGGALGVLCIDADRANAFIGFEAGAIAVLEHWLPLLSDLEFGLLLWELKAHGQQAHAGASA